MPWVPCLYTIRRTPLSAGPMAPGALRPTRKCYYWYNTMATTKANLLQGRDAKPMDLSHKSTEREVAGLPNGGLLMHWTSLVCRAFTKTKTPVSAQ